MEEEPEVGFVLGIFKKRSVIGQENYAIQSQFYGISKEIILSIVRTWLRDAEDEYYDQFKRETNSN